jgi:hypothetical protein
MLTVILLADFLQVKIANCVYEKIVLSTKIINNATNYYAKECTCFTVFKITHIPNYTNTKAKQ